MVGPGLLEQLGPRLGRFQTLSCEAEEAAFLKTVDEQHPKVVLADAADPATPALLQAYQKLGREANSFLLVSDDGALEQRLRAFFPVPEGREPAPVTLEPEVPPQLRPAAED